VLSISLATTIGLVAGCLSSWSLVPQLLKCWRDGLTEAVSKKMFATRAFGLVLWVVYGFFGWEPSADDFQLRKPRSEHHDPSPHSAKVVTSRSSHRLDASGRTRCSHNTCGARAGPGARRGALFLPKTKVAVHFIIARVWRSSARFWNQAVRPRRRRGGAGKSKDRAGGVFAPSPRR
jgi:PQ loop repeat